ncbi:hypothetical protein ACFL3J_01510 [Candidatus Omnitrophota bacterium]
METLKNFLVGSVITILGLILVGLGFFLWPLLVGITSFVLFVGVIILSFILVFYIVVLIGHLVRKGFKTRG